MPTTTLLPSEGFPLKVEYGHSTSQLEALLGQIAASKEEGGTPISVISLQIGSNDELHALGACENGLYLAAHGFTSIIECAAHEAGPEGFLYSGGLISHILTNIGTTIGVIREAGYTGRIVVQGFYNPFATLLEGSDKLVEVLNGDLEGLDRRESLRSKPLARQALHVGESGGPAVQRRRNGERTRQARQNGKQQDLQVHRNVQKRDRAAEW